MNSEQQTPTVSTEHTTRMIVEAKTQASVESLVSELLTLQGEHEEARTETYAETAERVRQAKPWLAELLDAAETRWFELEDKCDCSKKD